jgi:hypothetical protein
MILATHGIIGSSIVQFTGLLDTYSGAAAAYSLRKLRTAYTGDAIRVRRASDNTEQNIGFVNNELDTASLTSFCSGTNGFVTTWYDQSGNGYNATQSTGANQPQIVSSGSVIEKNSKATLDFDGTSNSLFYNGNFLGGSAGSGFAVSSFDNSTRTAREIIYGLQDTTSFRYDFLIARQASNAIGVTQNAVDFYVEGNLSTSSINKITDTNQRLYSNIYENNVIRKTFTNSIETYSDVNNLGNLDDGTDFYIGMDIINAAWIDGKIQEIIIYGSNQSSNRTGIETNINDFYSIY